MVHAFLPFVLQCLDSSGVKALLLTLKKVLRSGNDVVISPIPVSSGMFFMLEKIENNQMVPSQENREGD